MLYCVLQALCAVLYVAGSMCYIVCCRLYVLYCMLQALCAILYVAGSMCYIVCCRLPEGLPAGVLCAIFCVAGCLKDYRQVFEMVLEGEKHVTQARDNLVRLSHAPDSLLYRKKEVGGGKVADKFLKCKVIYEKGYKHSGVLAN